jgi:hypothetical protein
VAISQKQIAQEADIDFPNHHIVKQFELIKDVQNQSLSIRDALGLYIAKTIKDIYDPNIKDAANLRRIIASLDEGQDELQQAIGRLEMLLHRIEKGVR